MKPRLFRLKDITIVGFPLLLAMMVIGAIVWNYTSINGEDIPIQGLFVSSLMILVSFTIIFIYYYKRYSYISQYRYTTKHGVACYFEHGTKLYLLIDVEKVIDDLLKIFAAHYISSNIDGKHSWKYIHNSSVVFKNGSVILFMMPGYLTRKVYGISGWNWVLVGQGAGMPVENTALRHEIAHIFINNWDNKFIPENKAHELFRKIGI